MYRGRYSLMRHSLRVVVLSAVCALFAQPAAAQSTSTSGSQTTPSQTSDEATRPATTTFYGDTGLWFVPTAEVLPHGKWSVSGYRRGTNYIQEIGNVGDYGG